MDLEEIRSYFGESAKARHRPRLYTQKTWENLGISDFKINVMGLCGTETVKSLDQIADVLVKLEVLPSIDDAKSLVETVAKNRYPLEYGDSRYLSITPPSDPGNVYTISRCFYDEGPGCI